EPRQPGAQVRALRERAAAEPHRRRHQHELLPDGRAPQADGHLLHPPQLQGQRGLQARPAPVRRLPGREALPARVVHRGHALAVGQAHAAALRAARLRGRRLPARQERRRPPDPGVDRLRPDPGRGRLRRGGAGRGEAGGELRVVPALRARAPPPLRGDLHRLRGAALPGARAPAENAVVTCFAGGPEAVYRSGPEKHLIASYYRNTIIHFFVNGAIAELALLRAAEDGIADPAAEFWDEAIRLRDLLKFEFFFAEKDAFREELREEVGLHDAQWESRLT